MNRVNLRTDEDLMLATGEGDLAAFEQLVLRHQNEVWRVAYRFTGDATEAEDLAQEACLRILDAAPRYKPTAAFRTYFYRVVTRLCLDHRRKKRPVLFDLSFRRSADESAPAQLVERQDRDRFIQIALRDLPADYRMALVLRYFEGLSTPEIAAAMGRTVKAVERLLARARETLEPRLRPLL